MQTLQDHVETVLRMIKGANLKSKNPKVLRALIEEIRDELSADSADKVSVRVETLPGYPNICVYSLPNTFPLPVVHISFPHKSE